MSACHCHRLQSVGSGLDAGFPLLPRAKGMLIHVVRESSFGKYCPSWEESNHRLEFCQSTGGSNRLGGAGWGVSFSLLFRGKEGKRGALFTQEHRIYLWNTDPTPN